MKTFCNDYIDDISEGQYKNKYDRSYFSEKELSVEICKNAIVLPTKKFAGEFFPRSGILNPETNELYEISKIQPARVVKGYDFDSENVVYDDRDVIFAGVFWQQWGHFILEQISRLYYFFDDKSDMPIIYTAFQPLEGNYLEFFELLGINTKRLVRVNNLTKFKSITVPEASICAMRYYTKEYKQIFEKVKSNVAKSEVEKVYFSTLDYEKSNCKDKGECEKIENLFRENGYEIFSPEKMTLKEQISLMKGAKQFAAFAGTLPHNLLFASKEIKPLIINKSYIINHHQALVDSAAEVNSVYIDAHLSILPQTIGGGPFFYYAGGNLLKYAKQNNLKIPEQTEVFENSSVYGYLACWLTFYLRCVENNNFRPDNLNFLIENKEYYLKKLRGYRFLPFKLFVKLFYALKLYNPPKAGLKKSLLKLFVKTVMRFI